tara:strand:+ start:707 stop:976 length:270 start_codon:yes stop_codon:yes gene_type:complete
MKKQLSIDKNSYDFDLNFSPSSSETYPDWFIDISKLFTEETDTDFDTVDSSTNTAAPKRPRYSDQDLFNCNSVDNLFNQGDLARIIKSS